MLHIIWILCSLSLIFFIILHNPKSQNIGNQNQFFGTTRSAEENINKITWTLVVIFFLLAICLSTSNIE